MLKTTLTKHLRRVRNATVALLFVATQVAFPIATSSIAKAAAPPKITAKTHQGQEAPGGTYTPGNVTTYKEGDDINFRFNLEANAATSGQLQVRFTGDDSSCLFFNGAFSLGTHDGSASAIESISGVNPTVTTSGIPVATDFGTSSGEWVQTLNISFSGAGEARINYWLTLSDEAGECNGSSQHSRLNPAGGDVQQTGEQNVPVPANQIIELPEIIVTKMVDTDADGIADRPALAGEWSFSLDGANPVVTDANGQVIFTNVTPDGEHEITESNGPSGQTFLNGTGTNCTFYGDVATATVASGTTAEDATCVFTNGVRAGSITISKNAIPDSAQDFSFTVTGTGLSNFSLDNDNNATLPSSKTFSNLLPGVYSVTEAATSGWDFDGIVCSAGSSVVKNGATVTITLSAGQNVSCAYTNRQRGQIVVHKTTVPANDQTSFNITATGTGSITGPVTRTLSTSQDVTYDVAHGTYAVSEDLSNTPGWVQTNNTCSGLVINGDTPLVNGVPTLTCTITNTKLAQLTIVKNAIPDGPQDFTFTSTGTGLSTFSLDDDSDLTLPNQMQFSNLMPGSYSVTEGAILDQAGKPLWDLSSLTCTGTTAYNQTGSTLNLTISAGDVISCTFTNTQRGSISGTKYTANADGSLGAVLNGWTIYIDANDNGSLDNGEQSTVTGQDGSYNFSNVLGGTTYVIRELLSAGWTQIFGPSPVTLSAGQNSTENDFGNFQNGTINGYKWNDQNGNGEYDNEPKLAGWTIYIDANDNGSLDNGEQSTVTGQDGSYSFSNLAPGTFVICEVAQQGWTQTYPANDACHSVVINISGETESRNFGNQGRGSIQVIKNVDTDGDGIIDTYGATDWSWNIDGTGGYATGSIQNIAAGTYTVSEEQKANYHVTASSCSSDNNSYAARVVAAESLEATVTPGENIVCTFTNTRDTGFITVNKTVSPHNDNGKFNLTINDIAYATNVGDGGTTGKVRVPTGTYQVGETAGTNTTLADYSTTNECNWNTQRGGSDEGTSVEGITVAAGEEVTCTFTNTRLGTITVIKDARPNDGQDFTFKITRVAQIDEVEDDSDYLTSLLDGGYDGSYSQFELDDDEDATLPNSKTTARLAPGTYYITEESVEGWDLTDISCCGDGVQYDRDGATISVTVEPGSNITCTFTNTKRGQITIVKDAQPDSTQQFDFVGSDGEETVEFGLVDDGEDESLASHTFSSLLPGVYEFSESAVAGWTLSSISCGEGLKDGIATPLENGGIRVTLTPGTHMICTFTNTRDTGSITVTKTLTPASNTGRFNLLINGVVYAMGVGDSGSTGAVNLPTGSYTVSETGATNTILGDYETSYTCKVGTVVIASGRSTSSATFTLQKGQSIVCNFTNNKGEILPAATTTTTPPEVLVNTGSDASLASIAGATIIGLVAAMGLASRRRVITEIGRK